MDSWRNSSHGKSSVGSGWRPEVLSTPHYSDQSLHQSSIYPFQSPPPPPPPLNTKRRGVIFKTKNEQPRFLSKLNTHSSALAGSQKVLIEKPLIMKKILQSIMQPPDTLSCHSTGFSFFPYASFFFFFFLLYHPPPLTSPLSNQSRSWPSASCAPAQILCTQHTSEAFYRDLHVPELFPTSRCREKVNFN